jgi:hypothetical protein
LSGAVSLEIAPAGDGFFILPEGQRQDPSRFAQRLKSLHGEEIFDRHSRAVFFSPEGERKFLAAFA